MPENFQEGGRLVFAEEPGRPYIVQAANAAFAVLTRLAEVRDYEELGQRKEEGKSEVVYTLVDLRNGIRGPHGLAVSPYNYTRQSDIRRCLQDLSSGKVSISPRNRAPVRLV